MKRKMINLLSLFFIWSIYGCQKNSQQKYEELIKPVIQKMNSTQRIVDGELEPPFPEKLGDDAIGTDINENEIRDDIEIWINFTAKDSNERKAMKQLAFALTQEIKDAHLLDDSTAYKKSTNTQRAIECLGDVVIEPSAFEFKLYSIYDLVFYPRFRSSLKEIHSRFMAGKIIGTHGENDGKIKPFRYCNFGISK